MITLKTILHPTDFSESSRYALEVACALARDQAARVLLLHVLPRPSPIGTDPAVPAFKDAHTGEDLQAYREEMAGLLAKACEEASCANIVPLLKEGPVADVITRTAAESPCDLIVMGTHGRSRTHEFPMGSVAKAVMRSATCPIVTVEMPVPQR